MMMSADRMASNICGFSRSATSAERVAARHFYFEAHRMALWFAAVSGVSLDRVAAILATLSPRNSWESTQHDAAAILLPRDLAHRIGGQLLARGVNSFGALPRDVRRARGIRDGFGVDGNLTGPKTRAFRDWILDPETGGELPVDVHLARAALGRLASMRTTGDFIRSGRPSITEGYRLAANRLNLKPIEVANRCWFVLRRLSAHGGQHSIATPALAWRPLYGVGPYPPSRRIPRLNLVPGCPRRPWLEEQPTGTSFGNETPDSRGRVRVTLGRHRFANSGQWQYRYRLLVAYELGRLPKGGPASSRGFCEHVDHRNGCLDDDRIENLRVLSASLHQRHHARGTVDAEFEDGEFREVDPDEELALERNGPVATARRFVAWGEVDASRRY